MHAGMLEWKFRRTYGRGTGRDENSLAAQQRVRSDTHRVGINKTRRTMKRRDVVDSHLLFSASAFVNRDGRFVAHEIPNGGLSPEREIHAKELARTYAGEGQRCFAKKLHRSFAKTRAREGQYLCFPSLIADDGNLLKVVAVAEEKVCIAPLLAAFPSRKVFQQDEKLDRSGNGDFFHELGLHSIEFGFLQFTTDAKDEKTISVLFEIGAHGCLVWRLWKE